MNPPAMRNALLLSSMLALTTAATDAPAQQTGAGKLAIDPSLCVLEPAQQSCTTPLRIRWQLSATETGAVCLFDADQMQALFCTETIGNGERELRLPLSRDTRFELRQRDTNALLAAVTVTVAKPLSDLRPRRRHGWGIF